MRAHAPSVDTVLAAIRVELAGGTSEAESENPVPAGGVGIAELRRRLARSRVEPIGGRFLFLKRIVFWFVASAFDRQTKLIEAMLDELALQEAEIARLRSLADEAEEGDAATGIHSLGSD